ncbi:PREDICTED: beclin 1-associated autophagy-related key regulator [Rhagoletis zephyria]|uniref:beclin 1-associated autophagy-related key regulator n=1 Tax=Rhagoletis zephyria TaxID=28612 RepID=UPI0008117E04|nr:PREDICTED: beclin 1-associated autophagy-related key regulator [Rhagoletis zephyria]
MASMSSSSTDESFNAPNLKFHVSSSSEDVCKYTAGHANPEDILGLRYHCPLCGKSQHQHNFHCCSCVRNGNIVHSNVAGCTQKENLFEKQQKYIKIKGGLKDLSIRYERFMREQRSSENLQCEIKRKKQRIQLLNRLITEKQALLANRKEQRDLRCKANIDKRKQLPNYPIKVKALEDYVFDRLEKIIKLRELYGGMMNKVQQVTRHDINQLVKYIFQISEVVLQDEKHLKAIIGDVRGAIPSAGPGGDASNETNTMEQLADAKNTSYIRGKWVFHGSGISEMQYRIVAPSLPANGDYTAYLDWLTDNKDDVPKNEGNHIAPSRISAFRIIGALTYTTQLTELMSYYLNVRLPHRVAYGDFCRKLNEEQFLRKVSRLNSNIMYLAYTQQVQLRNLNENHTLENILAILDVEKSNLGRHGFYEISNAPLMKSVDSLLKGIETATESESEEENSLRLDWESVPNFPDEPEISESDLIATAAAQQSSITGGLMTTAANRISAILRWRR